MRDKDVDFIEKHLRNLNITIDVLNRGIQKNEWNEHESAGMGAYLANVYSGYENIFKTLLNSDGIKIPKSEQWHINLLHMANSSGLVPWEMSETLKGMLSFRHVQVHGYSHTFQEKELRHSSLETVKSHPVFEKHIRDIIEKKITEANMAEKNDDI